MQRLKVLSPVTAGFILAFTIGCPAVGHEFWVEPKAFTVSPGTAIAADLKVGQDFKGNLFPYLKSRFVSFKVTDRAGSRDVKGDEGDLPAVYVRAPENGFKIVTYHSTADRLTYDAWENFVAYAEKDGLTWALEAHDKRGLSRTGFTETYTRCAKGLIQSGGTLPGDQDIAVGMPLELVAGKNPYSGGQLREMPVTLLWHGKPIRGIRITTFQDTGTVTETTTETDAEGKALIALTPGARVMMSAVHMQEAPPERNAQWDSYWASLTFKAPD